MIQGIFLNVAQALHHQVLILDEKISVFSNNIFSCEQKLLNVYSKNNIKVSRKVSGEWDVVSS